MTADVLFPTSADEAASLYGDGEGITVFAGGTILLPEIASGRVRPERALLLHRSGLDTVSVDGDRVTLGAMVPVAALAASDDTVLAQVAGQIADEEVRRNATVGGNLCAPAGGDAQRGDLGAALIALGAHVRSAGAGGERTEPVEDFLAGDRSGRLVLDVSYERRDRHHRADHDAIAVDAQLVEAGPVEHQRALGYEAAGRHFRQQDRSAGEDRDALAVAVHGCRFLSGRREQHVRGHRPIISTVARRASRRSRS